MENNLSFSKIVATPTLASWSQAYNAGKLFAVLSLEKIEEENQDSESLNSLGRNLLEKLEQEFFTLEEKNLESVKNAIFNAFAEQKEKVNLSFAGCAFVNNVLYLFTLGQGKVFIKRKGAFGLILDSPESSKEITSSSGFIKSNDLIVLATNGFSEVITNNDLNLSLDDSLPSEITESLAPRIHKAENGKISAIIIRYEKPKTEEIIDEEITAEEEIKQEEENQEQVLPFYKYWSWLKSKLKKPSFKLGSTRKLFLIITVIIIGILISAVFLAIQNQNNAKAKALFEKSFSQALKKYDEGQSLLDLNKNLARDSLLTAQKIINENKNQFSAKSKEDIQFQELLKKIADGLLLVSPIDKSGLDRSKLSIVVANGSGIEGTAGKAANILKDFGYNVTSTGNADNFNYTGITIKVKEENSKFLELLKKDLAKDYTVTASSSDLPSDSSTSALIIIGK